MDGNDATSQLATTARPFGVVSFLRSRISVLGVALLPGGALFTRHRAVKARLAVEGETSHKQSHGKALLFQVRPVI